MVKNRRNSRCANQIESNQFTHSTLIAVRQILYALLIIFRVDGRSESTAYFKLELVANYDFSQKYQKHDVGQKYPRAVTWHFTKPHLLLPSTSMSEATWNYVTRITLRHLPARSLFGANPCYVDLDRSNNDFTDNVELNISLT